MDIRDALRIGDRLDVQFGSVQYRFKIVEIKDGSTFVVAQLGGGAINESHAVGNSYGVFGYSEAGRLEFQGELARRNFNVQGLPAMEFRAVSELKYTQRRDSYRLPIIFPLKYTVLSKEGAIRGRNVWKGAMAANLGDGGIMISAEEGYAVGSELQMRFSLEGQHLLINGIVRRSDFEVTQDGSLEFVMGIEFTSGNQVAKQVISKFVMQCQINNRNRAVQ